jgi:uncharacterized membrane protein (GlpM family)
MTAENEADRRLAQLSLVAGVTALAVAALFAYLNGGLGTVTPPEVTGSGKLLGFILSALVFQFGTPFLCAAALIFGFRTRDRWPGRLGMVAGLLAILPYLAFLRACYAIVSA